jgi:hypothetical protein
MINDEQQVHLKAEYASELNEFNFLKKRQTFVLKHLNIGLREC